MGYDLYAENGEHFQATIWRWSLLWEYVTQHCAAILSKEDIEKSDCTLERQITKEQALGIAECLDELLHQGRVAQHERAHKWYADNAPLQECRSCNGTGTTDDQFRDVCHECGGDGCVPDARSWFLFCEENVREFAAFCRASGGFSIC